MKTKIETISAICILGFIGLININAIADGYKSVNTESVTGRNEVFTNESWMTDQALYYSPNAFSTRDIADEIENYAAEQNLLGEDEMMVTDLGITDQDLFYSAKEFSARDIDEEIEKVAQEQNSGEESAVTESDTLNSAELFTESGTEQEIEKYAQNQISLEQSKIGK